MQKKLVTEELTQQKIEQLLWKATDILRGAVRPEGYSNYILPLLFFKRLSDVFLESQALLKEFGSEEIAAKKFHRFLIPEGCSWYDVREYNQNVGQKLNTALAQIAKSNPPLEGVINRADFNKQDELPPDQLIRLIEHLSQMRLGNLDVTPEILGNVFEYLLKRFNEVASLRAGEFYAPREVIRMMVGVLNPVEGYEVYDPCCGSGGTLIESHFHLLTNGQNPQKLSLYGQEINGNTWAIAMMNILLHDMEAELHQGDSFADPKFITGSSLREFDIVIANPTWNQDGYDDAFYENDMWGRFRYGTPPRSSADWGWMQHTLASLGDNGRAAVVLDTGSISRGSGTKASNREKNIRKAFVENDFIEAVILLPDNLFYNTTAPAVVLLLNQKKPTESREQILLINASAYFVKEKPKNVLTDEGIAAITETCQLWQTRDKLSKVVNLREIQTADYSLNPAQFVETSEPIPHGPVATVKTIAELAEEVIAGFSPKPEERKKHGKYLLLGGRNIKDGVLVKTNADSYIDDIPRNSFRRAIAIPGDVIVSTVFDQRKIYVFEYGDPPAVVNNSCAIIRSGQNGDYIGSYLRTIEGRRYFLDQTSKRTIGRHLPLDLLRSIQVPILSIAELSHFGDVRIGQSTKTELILLKREIESKDAEIESKDAEIESLKAEKERFRQNRSRAIDSQIKISEILSKIDDGESHTREFKSSLRWNLKAKKYDKEIENSVLKTICAFCNRCGGELLIGIDDEGTILGIEHDGFQNADKFQLHLRTLLLDRIMQNVAHIVDYKIIPLNGKMVCYIKCKRSNDAIWFKANKDTDEQFVVRIGSSSTTLSPLRAFDYINNYFKDTEAKSPKDDCIDSEYE